MNATWSGPGHEHDHSITRDGNERISIGVRRRAGTGGAPGSALIAVAAWLLALTYLNAGLNGSKS
jgi:hypothetical protein